MKSKLFSITISVFLLAAMLPPLFVLAEGGLGDTPWPTWGYDNRNTGQSPSIGPQAPVVKWAVQISNEGEMDAQPVIGEDGTIYVGTSAQHESNFYALNPDGTEKWTFQPLVYEFGSSAAIAEDGTVYVVGNDWMEGYRLFALDYTDGSLNWEFEVPTPIYSSPKVGDDGTVYFADLEMLYAVNADGTEKWNFTMGGWCGRGSIAIGEDDTIYVLAENTLYAVNPDGSEKWDFANAGYSYATAIADDGTVYIAAYEDMLYAVNPDGTEKWSVDYFSTSTSLAIGSDDTIYSGADDGTLYAFDSDGTEKWQFSAGSELWAPPAIGADGTIYLGSIDYVDDTYLGNVVALNPDGIEKWSYAIDDGIVGSPSIGADGTLYVPSGYNLGGKLYAFQDPLALPPMELTIVGMDSSQAVVNETDIANLDSYRAFGGYKTAGGSLKGLGNYTGVPIMTFLDMVGGITSGYSVKIIAADGFSKLMSFEELNGNLVTYDNVTGGEVQHNDTLTPILAYHYNDANLTDGPLKSAIVGPEGLLTAGSFWVKQVVRLELHANLQPMNLTIVGLDGTELVLNENEISDLERVRGVGAYRNQMGIVKSLGNYTGPSLYTLLDLVGGMNSDNVLGITAADNYTKIFTYAEVNGAFATYDNLTGLPVEHNQSLTPIVAYHYNDDNVSLSDGPLRTAIVGPEGLATGSSYWVKQVVKLEVRYVDDVAVSSVVPLKTVVGQNYTCSTNVTLQNLGGYTETFNLTLYANSSIVASIYDLVLQNGTEAVITLTWNTTGFGYGNYTIKAAASKVPDETNTTDNTFTSSVQIHVGVPGDVSSATLSEYEGIVNMRDIVYLVFHFNIGSTSPNWNPNADINDDGVVNMRDISIAVLNFNKFE